MWGRTRSRRRGWLGRAAPLVTGAVLAALLALAALLIGHWQLRHAERDRLANQVDLVESIASYRSQTDDPRILQTMVDNAGFSPTDAARDTLLLGAFDLTPTGNPTVAVALVDPAGHVVASHPAGAVISTAQLGAAWPAALRGQSGWSSAFVSGGKVVRAALAPVHDGDQAGGGATGPGGGQPRVVLVSLSVDTAGERFQERLGALERGAGGLSQLDRKGVAISSWRPAGVGQRVLEPAQVARLPPGRATVWRERDAAGHELTVIAAPQPTTGYVTAFQVHTKQLYGDLRDQQASRDRTLVGLLGGSALGLVLFGALRESAVRRTRARMYELIGNTHDIIVLVRAGLTVAFMSPSAHRLLGQTGTDWIGRPLLGLVHPEDRDRVETALTRLPSGETTVTDVRLRTGPRPAATEGGAPASGTGPEAGGGLDGFRWFDLTAVDERDVADLDGVLITCHEVGERKALQDRLSHQAWHDPLTGLANRATFLAQVAGALTRAAEEGTRDALLFIDLDGFKPVNDLHGHAAGDDVLRIVAQRILATLRPSDLAGRFGGDEFGVLLRDADHATAGQVSERLVAAIGRPIVLPPADAVAGGGRAASPRRMRVGASIGVALSARPAEATPVPDVHALLRAADHAMYEAKRARSQARTAFAPDPAPPAEPTGARPRPVPPAGPAGTPPDRPAAARTARPSRQDRAPSAWPSAAAEGARARRLWPRRAASRRAASRHATAGDPAASRTRRPWPGWLHTVSLLLTVAALLLGVVGIRLHQEGDARRTARAAALAQNRAVAAAFNDSAATILDPQRLVPFVSGAPWTFTNTAVDREILRRFAASAVGGPDTDLLLTSLTGQVLSTLPSTARLPVDTHGPLWRAAVAGRAQWTPVTTDASGAQRVYALEPVLRGDRAVAILVIGRSTHHGLPTVIFRSLAPLGALELVDATGRVAFGSDSAVVGKRVVDPAVLRGLPAANATEVRSADPHVISFAMPTGTIPGYSTLLQRYRAVVFDDLGSSLPGLGLLLGIVAFTLVAVAVADDRRRRSVRRDADWFEALLRGAHDIVAVAAPDGRIRVVGPSVYRLLHQQPTDWTGHDVADLVHPDDAARLRAFVLAAAAQAAPGADGPSPTDAHAPPVPRRLRDVRLRTAEGWYRWFDVTASRLPTTPDPAAAAVLLTCHDIGERKALQDELTAAAFRDPLTGLPNRAAFARRLDEAVLRVARWRVGPPGEPAPAPDEPGPGGGADDDGYDSAAGVAPAGGPAEAGWTQTAHFGVLFIDLDDFKPINDRYGHGTGDEVLEIIARRLEAAVRPGDTVARLGGDEFAVLAENTHEGQLIELAGSVVAALDEPLRTQAGPLKVAATIGAAVSTAYPDPLRTVRAADLAMYDAKRHGRARVALAGADGSIRPIDTAARDETGERYGTE
ncbi:diguanylate cyclase domain-containing protein [Pseudofrankia inefficax]|uniref:Diguanylate cyclase with PAS/PAC sensor n=1 Tax=Pseudofrankia inefficax (strain DSM 45817 / CECT 9037 / DDB 130130 / EuI1c) TaxID=298654 RepID=E3J4B8_PSEI1|nr:diguanylate cyclase [Pseudofrankia inefficax]ADP83037.1 diguanylate cyclase with PAS/PAC sensor [Pseudofrankia inefficax]